MRSCPYHGCDKNFILFLFCHICVLCSSGGGCPVMGMLAGINMSKAGMDLSKAGMNPSKPGEKHHHRVIINYICLCVSGLLQSFHWCSNVGCNSMFPQWHSTVAFQWCSSVPCKYSLGCPVLSIPMYTGSTSYIPVALHWASRCTLAQGKGMDMNSLSWAILYELVFLRLVRQVNHFE